METERVNHFSEKELFQLFSDVDSKLLSKSKCPRYLDQDYCDKINELPPQSHINYKENPNLKVAFK